MTEARAKILCVEDDPETATVLAGEFLDRGFEVYVAHNGQEGFIAILRWVPDLVLCDISLPATSSLEVLERLTRVAPRFRQMPFIFLTDPTGRECELEGRQLGADNYVAKPIDFDVLVAIITARLAPVVRNNNSPKSVVLNERQIEVLTWAARGNTSAEIAQLLGLTKRTVDFHMDNARAKLGATTRIEAVTKAVSGQLIEPYRKYSTRSGRLPRQSRRMGRNQ